MVNAVEWHMNDINTENAFVLSSLSMGSRRAFDAFFKAYYPKILQFVMHFCIDKQEAESLVQDLFMNLWIKRDKLGEVKNLDNYLYVSARNAAIRLVKQSFIYCDDNVAKDLPSELLNGDMKLCYEELYSFVMREINSMPEQRRRIFLMSRVDGLSNAKIAERLGIGKRTVESHISLAIATLREIWPSIILLTILD